MPPESPEKGGGWETRQDGHKSNGQDKDMDTE